VGFFLEVIVNGMKVALVADNEHVPARGPAAFMRYLTVCWRDKRRADWTGHIDTVVERLFTGDRVSSWAVG